MSLLDDIDAVVFDVDGTLLHANDPSGPRGAHPIAGAVEAVARVRASGRRVLFFTNGTGRPPAAVRGRHPRPRVRARRRGVHEPGGRRRALDRSPPPGEVGARPGRARRGGAAARPRHRDDRRRGAGGRRHRARRLGRRAHLRGAAAAASRSGRARRCSRRRRRRSSRSTAAPAPGWSGAVVAGIRQTTGARRRHARQAVARRVARGVPGARRRRRPGRSSWATTSGSRSPWPAARARARRSS